MSNLQPVQEGKVLDTESYNFPVELQPIFLGNGREVTERKAVVRTDTMQPLGIVSNGYGLVKHNVVIDAFREGGKKYGIEEKIMLTNNGAHMYYQMLFPKVQMEVAKNDLVQMRIIVKNSYDAHGSLQIIFGAMRLVCLNGMVLGAKFLQFNYMHVGNVKGFADISMIEQCKEAYKHHIKLFGEKSPMISQMAKTPMIEAESHFDKKYVSIPNYLIGEAKHSYESEKDQTVWGYYNALTYAVTHKQKKENPKQMVRQGVAAWRAAEKFL